MLGVSLEEALQDGEKDVIVEVVGAELIDGAKRGLSSTKIATGSRKTLIGGANGLSEGAAMIDGDDDAPVGLVEGLALRDGLEEGLDDRITDTIGVLLG